MKKRILTAVLALFVVGLFFAQDRVISERELPVGVKNNVAKYFGKRVINSVVKDVDGFKTTYEIYFSDQTKAEFRSNGVLKEAKNHNGLPAAVIPTKIQAYVKKHYPNTVITKYDRGSYKQEIELNNGLDLEFSLKGDFLRIDN